MLVHVDTIRTESPAQDLDRLMRFGSAAHEDVHGGVVALRPTMDADMRFRQHRHAGDTVVRREVVQVDVKQRSTRCLDAFLERRLDVLAIFEPFSSPEDADYMWASVARTTPLPKVG